MMMIKMIEKRERLTNNKNIYLFLFCMFALVIYFVSARHASELINIMAWDEIGYWGNGAHIAGYDWSSVVSTYAGYYSYGYSLIVALLLKICGNAHIAYQSAIIINSLFNEGSFLLANYVGIQCFGRKNRYYVLLASFITSIYVNNITQSNFAWTECILIFLYWCLIALYLSLNKKYHSFKLVMIVVLTVYIYCVHNRSLGIVIASIMTLVAYISFRKIPKKDILFISVIAFILVIAEEYYKGSIKSAVFVGMTDGELVNTVASASPWIIGKLQSVYGILDLIKTFLNRFLYFGITTFGTFWAVMIHAIKKIYVGIVNKRLDFFVVFLVLSVLGTFGLMTLQLSQAGTYQALLYGRYQDIVIGPIFLLGLLGVLLKAFRDKKFIKYIFIMPIALKILMNIARSIPIYADYFVPNCNVSLYKYWIGLDKGGYDFDRIFLVTILAIVVFSLICYVNRCDKRIGLLLLLCLTIVYGINQYQDSESVFASSFTNYQDMSDELLDIHKICKNTEEVYFYNDTSLSITQPLAMWLQLEMFDHKIVVINDIEDVPFGSYVVLPRRYISNTEFGTTIEVSGKLISSDKFAALYYIQYGFGL